VIEPNKVRLEVSKAYSQLGTQLLVRSQHGAQPVGTNPVNKKSLTLKFSLSNRKFTSNFSHVSQHAAPTCVRHKPRPEKYFEILPFFFPVTSNHFVFPTAIFTLSFKSAHVIELFNQHEASEHELSKIPIQNTLIFFLRNFSFNFFFFRTPEIPHLHFFFTPSSHFENFSSDT